MDRELVQRISQYRKVLYKLKSLGFAKVFSDNLGDALGVSAALVRKDFAACELSGHKRGGYQVNELLDKLNELLGNPESLQVILVGCGKIGTALLNYNGFQAEGIRVIAGFDANPERISPEAAIPIHDIKTMPAIIEANKVKVAILAVPEEVSFNMAEKLRGLGIRGILNFAPVPLKSTPDCNIENMNIALEVEKLFFFISLADRQRVIDGTTPLIENETSPCN